MKIFRENISSDLAEAISRCENLISDHQDNLTLPAIVNRLSFLLSLENGEIESNDEVLHKLASLNLGFFALNEAVFYDKELMLNLCDFDYFVRFNLLNEPLLF